jgi:predicted dehydrogenase
MAIAASIRPVNWGILGVSRFGQKKSVPRMMNSPLVNVEAIASRQLHKAQAAAAQLRIPASYGSYEELLADPNIEAVYITLPNHLHVEWSIRAARAGKHVLCEKPIALNAMEAKELALVQKETGRLVVEAFMVRSHPQWTKTKEIIASGRIGNVRHINCLFSYNNVDPSNIRNIREAGGGALLDIGCYAVNIARWIFANEPLQVSGLLELDDTFKVDRLTTSLMRFEAGTATFTCATQLVPFERVQILGTSGRIELKMPFKGLTDQPSIIDIDDGSDVLGGGIETLMVPCADHFSLQAEDFCYALRDGNSWERYMIDSVRNATVIDAIIRSAESGRHELV